VWPGVEALNNVLIIGMTNHLDLLDDALLRPGRCDSDFPLSVHSLCLRFFVILSLRERESLASAVLSWFMAGLKSIWRSGCRRRRGGFRFSASILRGCVSTT
jgi:hypothetical protein